MEPENKAKIAQTDPALQSNEKQGSEPKEPAPEPAPEPQPPIPEPQPESAPSITIQPPKKSNKALVIILVVLLLATVGVAVYFLLNKANQPTSNNSQQDQSSQTSQDGASTDDTASDEETAITNQETIGDLDYKIAALLSNIDPADSNANYSNKILATSSLTTAVDELFSGSLTEEQQQAIAIKSKRRPADFANDTITRQAIIDYINATLPDYMSQTTLDQIDGKSEHYSPFYTNFSEANELYKELFGKTTDLPQSNISGNICFEAYWYLNNLYVDRTSIGLSMCGGTAYPWIFTHKDSYTTKGDEAYINVRIITSQMDSESQYSNNRTFYSGYGDAKNLKEIRKTEDGPTHSYATSDVSDSDFETAAKYRFVFKKNPATGTYYFVKLEKL